MKVKQKIMKVSHSKYSNKGVTQNNEGNAINSKGIWVTHKIMNIAQQI